LFHLRGGTFPKFFQELFLAVGEMGGEIDDQADIEVAAGGAGNGVQIGGTVAGEANHGAGLSARANFKFEIFI